MDMMIDISLCKNNVLGYNVHFQFLFLGFFYKNLLENHKRLLLMSTKIQFITKINLRIFQTAHRCIKDMRFKWILLDPKITSFIVKALKDGT